MITMNARTIAQLADRLAPQIAERLVARPQPGLDRGNPDELLSEIAAAAILGMQPSTLCAWRSRDRGPPFLRIGPGTKPAVKYRRRVVLAFRDARETNPGGR